MIRKAILVILTLASLATAMAWVWSLMSPFSWDHYRSFVFGHVYGSVFPGPSWHSRSRVDLVAGKAYLRHAFSIDIDTPFPTITEDVGGGMVEIAVVRPSGRWRFDASDDTADERRLRNQLNASKYIHITIRRLPLWAPFILFAAYPTIAFIRGPLCRYRRRRKGLCIRCGYNLTGNVSGICPECGREVGRA